jgi:uncharacterized protein (DUF1330 family)
MAGYIVMDLEITDPKGLKEVEYAPAKAQRLKTAKAKVIALQGF